MSTLLTPIVTQLELDRDRFKGLINGTETDTVDLEGRTEKSIAGQVKDRIDDMAVDLTTAVDDAESAATSANSYKTDAESAKNTAVDAKVDAEGATVTAEGARDQTLSYKDDTENYFNNVSNMYPDIMNAKTATVDAKNDAQSAKTSAEAFANAADVSKTDATTARTDAETAASQAETEADEARSIRLEISDIADDIVGDTTNVDIVYPPKKIHPTEDSIIDPTKETVFTSTVPIVLSDQATFNERTINIQVYDDVFEEWQPFKTMMGMSMVVSANEFDDTEEYRWNVTDSVKLNDKGDPKVIESPQTLWEPISFSQNSNSTRYDYVGIDQPTATLDGLIIDGDNFSSPDGASFLNSACMVRNKETGLVVFSETVETEEHTIPLGVLSPSTEYECSIRYAGLESGNTFFSEWSDFVSLTTESSSYTQQAEYKAVESVDIDHETGVLFSVDGTTDPSITITTPSTGRLYELTVYVNGTGTVTWPTGIEWDGGSEPSLGASFTLLKLFWVGSQWVGKLEASA